MNLYKLEMSDLNKTYFDNTTALSNILTNDLFNLKTGSKWLYSTNLSFNLTNQGKSKICPFKLEIDDPCYPKHYSCLKLNKDL